MTTLYDLVAAPCEVRAVLTRLRGTVENARLPWLDATRVDALHLAVAEAVRNAIEHGRGDAPDRTVAVGVRVESDEVRVSITDQGPGILPATFVRVPDPTRKLRGEEGERGWGLFLIRSLVDDVRTRRDHLGHHLDLTLRADSRGSVNPLTRE